MTGDMLAIEVWHRASPSFMNNPSTGSHPTDTPTRHPDTIIARGLVPLPTIPALCVGAAADPIQHRGWYLLYQPFHTDDGDTTESRGRQQAVGAIEIDLHTPTVVQYERHAPTVPSQALAGAENALDIVLGDIRVPSNLSARLGVHVQTLVLQYTFLGTTVRTAAVDVDMLAATATVPFAVQHTTTHTITLDAGTIRGLMERQLGVDVLYTTATDPREVRLGTAYINVADCLFGKHLVAGDLSTYWVVSPEASSMVDVCVSCGVYLRQPVGVPRPYRTAEAMGEIDQTDDWHDSRCMQPNDGGKTLLAPYIVTVERAVHLPLICETSEHACSSRTVRPTTYVSYQAFTGGVVCTDVVAHATAPEWNHTHKIVLNARNAVASDVHRHLRFKVWHKRESRGSSSDDNSDAGAPAGQKYSDKLLGCASVDLRPFASGFSEISGWYHVRDAADVAQGQLKIRIAPRTVATPTSYTALVATPTVLGWGHPGSPMTSPPRSQRRDHAEHAQPAGVLSDGPRHPDPSTHQSQQASRARETLAATSPVRHGGATRTDSDHALQDQLHEHLRELSAISSRLRHRLDEDNATGEPRSAWEAMGVAERKHAPTGTEGASATRTAACSTPASLFAQTTHARSDRLSADAEPKQWSSVHRTHHPRSAMYQHSGTTMGPDETQPSQTRTTTATGAATADTHTRTPTTTAHTMRAHQHADEPSAATVGANTPGLPKEFDIDQVFSAASTYDMDSDSTCATEIKHPARRHPHDDSEVFSLVSLQEDHGRGRGVRGRDRAHGPTPQSPDDVHGYDTGGVFSSPSASESSTETYTVGIGAVSSLHKQQLLLDGSDSGDGSSGSAGIASDSHTADTAARTGNAMQPTRDVGVEVHSPDILAATPAVTLRDAACDVTAASAPSHYHGNGSDDHDGDGSGLAGVRRESAGDGTTTSTSAVGPPTRERDDTNGGDRGQVGVDTSPGAGMGGLEMPPPGNSEFSVARSSFHTAVVRLGFVSTTTQK